MDWQTVDSTNIRRIAHDADTDTLHVEFQNGRTYRHADVPQAEFDRLMAADSHGAHYNRYIRGRYQAELV